MKSRFSASVNKNVQLDTVFEKRTTTGALNAREVKQVNTNLSARCCLNIHASCYDPISALLSYASNGIKSLAQRTALSIYPTPARVVAISRQSLQRSSEHVHTMIEKLQTMSSKSKDEFIETLDRAITAAVPLMEYGDINFDEILRARIGSMQLEQKQTSNAISNTQSMLSENNLSDELRFHLRIINEALISLKQRPALALNSEKVLRIRSLTNDNKCLATLKKFLHSKNSKSAEKAFSTLEKYTRELLLNAKYFEKEKAFIDTSQIEINQRNISMRFIKEMMCKHSLALSMQSSEKSNPQQNLQLSLSYLSQSKRQELARIDYKFESVSTAQLWALSHVYGQKIQLEQLRKLGPALEKIIITNHQDRMKDMRKNILARVKVVSLIAEAAGIINGHGSLSMFSSDSRSTTKEAASQKIKFTHYKYIENKFLTTKNYYPVVMQQDFKNKSGVEKIFRWNEKLPEKIPRNIRSAENLKNQINYKILLRENAIFDLHPMLQSFAKSVNQQEAVARFKSIEILALRFVKKYYLAASTELAISNSARKLIQQEFINVRDRLIKDLLIIVFPVQEQESKRNHLVNERSTRYILPTLGKALSFLPVEKIDFLIAIKRGYVLISEQERADIHRISRLARVEKRPESHFTHPELDLFDAHFKNSANDLAEFLANI